MKNESAEFKEMLRDRGEKIMRLLIEDNGNTFMNFYACVNIAERISKGELNPNRGEDDIARVTSEYSMKPKSLDCMKRTSEFINKIGKIYHGKD